MAMQVFAVAAGGPTGRFLCCARLEQAKEHLTMLRCTVAHRLLRLA